MNAAKWRCSMFAKQWSKVVCRGYPWFYCSQVLEPMIRNDPLQTDGDCGKQTLNVRREGAPQRRSLEWDPQAQLMGSSSRPNGQASLALLARNCLSK